MTISTGLGARRVGKHIRATARRRGQQSEPALQVTGRLAMTSSDGKFSHGLTKGTQERKRACQVQGLESAKANQRATKLADLLGQEGLSIGEQQTFS